MNVASPPDQGEPLEGLLDASGKARLRERLLYLAWRRYRIPAVVAEDVVQAAFLTYLQVRDRYPRREEHAKILVGIFRNKCREHIDVQVRAARRQQHLREQSEVSGVTIRAVVVDATPEGGVLGEIVSCEELRGIFEALAELRPKAREMFRLIVDEGASREELSEHYGVNKNTLDSRLHAYRQEFRQALDRRGIHA